MSPDAANIVKQISLTSWYAILTVPGAENPHDNTYVQTPCNGLEDGRLATTERGEILMSTARDGGSLSEIDGGVRKSVRPLRRTDVFGHHASCTRNYSLNVAIFPLHCASP